MTTSATMTTMVMTITVRAVFFSCASMSKWHLGRVELQDDPHAVVLPHANKDRTVLQSRHAIHAGGSLSNCEISSICCCVIISNAVMTNPYFCSIGF